MRVQARGLGNEPLVQNEELPVVPAVGQDQTVTVVGFGGARHGLVIGHSGQEEAFASNRFGERQGTVHGWWRRRTPQTEEEVTDGAVSGLQSSLHFR